MNPTLLTPAAHETIVETLRIGGFLTTAAARAGIAESTLRKWMATGRSDLAAGQADTDHARLVADVTRVEGDVEARAVGLLQRAMAGGDVRAITWFLSHRFREGWSDHLSVEVGMDSEEFARVVGELAALAEGAITGATGTDLEAE